MYIGFIDLEKAYDRVNRGAVWRVLRIYDVSGKLLNGIKSMCFNSLACVKVRWEGKSECSTIDSGVRQGGIMSPWLLNVYMDEV